MNQSHIVTLEHSLGVLHQHFFCQMLLKYYLDFKVVLHGYFFNSIHVSVVTS